MKLCPSLLWEKEYYCATDFNFVFTASILSFYEWFSESVYFLRLSKKLWLSRKFFLLYKTMKCCMFVRRGL